MMLYKRSKLAINIFRNFSSRITPPKNPIQESIFPTTILQRFHGFLKQIKVNDFLENGSKRFNWLDPRREIVPYTKRNQFLLFSKSLEKKVFGGVLFNFAKEIVFDGIIVPATHPASVRMRSIANDIIGAFQKGLNKENSLSNEGVQQHRKKGKENSVDATDHLDGLHWEVLVIDKPGFGVSCLPGGKIIFGKRALEYLKSDAEIATRIGFKIAELVAQHQAERLAMKCSFTIVFLVFAPFVTFGQVVACTICAYFLRLYVLRRMVMEADYIGLLLNASAGYDPQLVLAVYENLDKLLGTKPSLWDEYLTIRPSNKTRARALAQAKVMEEAMLIYRKFLSGKRVKGFR